MFVCPHRFHATCAKGRAPSPARSPKPVTPVEVRVRCGRNQVSSLLNVLAPHVQVGAK